MLNFRPVVRYIANFWASDEAKARGFLKPDGKTMYCEAIKNNITAADISHGTYTSLWNTSMPYESNFIPTRMETTEQLVFIPTEFGVLHAVRTDQKLAVGLVIKVKSTS